MMIQVYNVKNEYIFSYHSKLIPREGEFVVSKSGEFYKVLTVLYWITNFPREVDEHIDMLKLTVTKT